MISYTKFRSSMLNEQNLSDSFVYQEDNVRITKDLEVYVNEEFIGEFTVLEEARKYARSYINNIKLVEDIDSNIPEEKIVTLIKKYHNIDKITSTIVESYKDLASSNLFTLDPVIAELNQTNIAGKYTYTLEDDSVVAISEETYKMLSNLLEDKYQIIDFMRQNKENFMHVVRTLKEE